MPGGGGGNLASGFGVGLGFGSLDSSNAGGRPSGGSADPSAGNIEVTVKFNDDAGRSQDLTIKAAASDRCLISARLLVLDLH